jgi:DNA-binding winged helix-turn-helix (wHTH) protein/TolB-like protein/Tfp pilus assembly protein PilF
MTSPTVQPAVYRFGIFEAKAETGELLKKGVRVKLQEQPFRLLCLLLEKSGGIVTKEDVRERLWPGNTFVEFDASLSVAVGKLRDALGDDSDNPRFIETVPRKGYRFVAPVERILPEPTSAAMPIPSPNTLPAIPQIPVSHVTPSPVKLKHALLICAAAVLLVGTFVFRSLRKQSASTAEAKSSPTAPQMRRSVAVLGFRNLPGRKDDDWLSLALTEMIGTELATGGQLRVVSDEDVARAKRELPLGDGETLAKPTLERLRKNPGADVVVVGSITTVPGKAGDRIRLDIRLQNTANGETIAEDAITGSKEDLFELATRAGSHLRESLGTGALSSTNANVVQASLPSNQKAIRYYSEGKAKLWEFDFIGARDLLLKAVAADPSYPLSHSALSDAWGYLGYGSQAKAEAKQALDLSGNLPENEKLLIEADYWELSNNLPKAVEIYRTLSQSHPDSLEYGLHLARVQYQVKPEEALATLRTLRQLPAPAGDDPRIDLLEASAQIGQNIVLAKAAAERALAKGTALGSPFIVSRAYGILCQQGVMLGVSTEENINDCEKARESYAIQGDRNNEARILSDLAGNYFQRGDLSKAESMWREAANFFRSNGGAEGLAATSNNLGDVYLLEGRLAEAKKMLEESIPAYRLVEDKSGVALALSDLGELTRLQGNLNAADAFLHQGQTVANEIGDKSALAYVISGLAAVLMERGGLDTAKKHYEESLALRAQTGEKQAEAETQVALAKLSIEEGNASEAEASVRKLIAQFHQEKQADDELTAYIVLIQSLLAQGKIAEAKQELAHAAMLSAKSQNFLARLQFDLASARASLASGDAKTARPILDAALKQVREHGYIGLEFEYRLTIAELERKSGNTAAAHAQLSALEQDAHAKGFGLIARKASAGQK